MKKEANFIIEKYLKDKKNLNILKNAYKLPELRDKHLFFQDTTLRVNTLIIILHYLSYSIHLSKILKKSFYFPGLGLFGIKDSLYNEKYQFPDTIINRWERNKFLEQSIQENKINIKFFLQEPYQYRVLNSKKTYSFYRNFYSKVNYLDQLIDEELGVEHGKLTVKNIKKYSSGNDLSDIIKDYNKPDKDGLRIEDFILENINRGDMIINDLLVKDIIFLIGYLENNEEFFGIK